MFPQQGSSGFTVSCLSCYFMVYSITKSTRPTVVLRMPSACWRLIFSLKRNTPKQATITGVVEVIPVTRAVLLTCSPRLMAMSPRASISPMRPTVAKCFYPHGKSRTFLQQERETEESTCQFEAAGQSPLSVEFAGFPDQKIK